MTASSKLSCLVILAAIVVFADAYYSQESKDDKETCSPCSSDLSALLSHYVVTFIRTVEVAFRGFLLGFGVTVLKDLLIDGKRGEEDRAAAFQYGKSVGLGMACLLVGMSVMIPTRLQEWAMENRAV